MNDSEFQQAADEILTRIERAIDASGSDIECMVEQGILTLEFDDGSRIVVNRHGVNREIWVAARAGGFHYRFVDGAWRNTRDGSELVAALTALIEQQGGERVVL